MDSNLLCWIICLIIALTVEALTTQLITIWFAIAAAGAMITYSLGFSPLIQSAVFVIITAICLILLRPVAKKLIKKPVVNTNVNMLIGKEILITEEVNNKKGTGEGKYNGQLWTVRCDDDNVTIPTGETRQCLRIEGVKLIVK